MIHGYKGSYDSHWFPYIAQEMIKHGVEVFAPQMPSDHTPEKWMEAVEGFKKKINENTILIGHSLGCSIILHILASLEKPVFGTILVAGFGKVFSIEDGNKKEEEECNAFVKDIAWKKVRKIGGKIKLFSSIDDPEISIDISIHLSTMLQSSLEFIENAGHFCDEDGFTKFQKLLDYIISQIYLTYDEFKKIDARVGLIKKVEPVEDADKLLRFEIDFGEGQDRQIVSGVREFFLDYESLVGKKALYVLNLEPREIKGITSYGMLMAVDDLEDKPTFLIPENDVNPGSHVR